MILIIALVSLVTGIVAMIVVHDWAAIPATVITFLVLARIFRRQITQPRA